MSNTNKVPEIEEVRRLIPAIREKYGPEVNLGSVTNFDDAYTKQQLPYPEGVKSFVPLLDQWYGAYETSTVTAARLRKEEFAVVAACLGGWAIDPIILGDGDRDSAWLAILELCGLRGYELNDVFNAMDSITTMS